jgi:tetratricopeptide (TPR) repeat protein
MFAEKYKDNYEEILPLEVFPNLEQSKGFRSDMDTVIDKCEKVIAKHSMPNPYRSASSKTEEHCKWIDETWLQISKSHFVLQEYKDAFDKFEFISSFYPRDKSSYEAKIWLSKVHILNREYPQAKILLKELEDLIEQQAEAKGEKGEKGAKSKKKKKKKRKKSKYSKKKKKKDDSDKEPDEFPKKLMDDFFTVKANYALAKEEYKEAAENIEKALEHKLTSRQKARYYYVLGQIYQREGNSEKAVESYSKCLKKNADYTMQFYAKINRALASGAASGEKLKKGLKKMLKDEKNEEFKDQIYYALANIAFKEGDKDQGIAYLNESIDASVNNNRQLAKTHLKLGDIYFKDKDYLGAQENYAAAAEIMPEDFPNYNGVKNKADGLLELVNNIKVVQLEDSLQMIASMDDTERYKFLEGVVDDIKEQERIKKEEEKAKLLAQQEKVNNFNQTMGGSGGKFWAYNAKLRGDGLSEFRKNWGNRDLEDNWRRSNKSTIKTDLGNDDYVEEIDSTVNDTDSLSADMLLDGIPLTEASIDSSNNRIIESLYNLGNIYKNDLYEEKLAIQSFQDILDRKIDHELVLPSAYQLYRIFDAKGSAKKEEYKNYILNNYPNSDYANVIRDPDYFKDQVEKLSADEEEYSKLVGRYRNKMYGLVIAKCNKVIATDSTNNFLPKYYLLKAYAIGKTSQNTETALRSPLEELIAKFPGTPEAKQAQLLIDRMGKIKEIEAKNDSISSTMQYDINMNQIQYFMMVSSGAVDDNQTKMNLSNFNKEYYRRVELKVTSSILKGDKQIYLVSSFATPEEAMDYLGTFKIDKKYFPVKGEFDYFIISKSNFTKLYVDKDVKHYLDFFLENYK